MTLLLNALSSGGITSLLVDVASISIPLEALQVATTLQSAVLVLIATATGAVLAPKVGVSAPAVSAVIDRGRVLDALRPQLLPGVIGGCIGAAVIIVFYTFAPESLATLQFGEPLPLEVRILYGGITEEILVRWGLMTAIAWAGWQLFQKGSSKPTSTVMWVAIVLSALLFGVSHLPVVAQAMPVMSGVAVAYVTTGNAVFGVVAGCLFWRYGLEAAITAHILAHLLASAILG